MPSPVIETTNLTKRFGKLIAVNNLNLKVEEGDTFGFLGPNGAGKTTTIKMLAGFLNPTAGSVRIFGYDIFRDGKEAKARFGIVPDYYGFYDELNAVEHLEYYAALYGIPKAERRKRIEHLLSFVGLENRKKSNLKEYSHGMRQRLVIAQALINEPELLILDEPTVGLDPKGQYETKELIKKLTREKKMTIFISSHQLHEVEELCTKVGIINRGNLIRVDTIANLSLELKKLKGIRVLVQCDGISAGIISAIKSLDGVKEVLVSGHTLSIEVSKPGLSPEINAVLVQHGARVNKLEEHQPSLEEIFLALTK